MGEFSIQISSSLIDQLTGGGEKVKRKPKKTRPRVSREAPRPLTKVEPKRIPDDSEIQKGPVAAGWPVQSSLFMPVIPPPPAATTELAAIQSVLKESEKVLEKLQKQEKNMAHEVTEKAKDLRDKEFKLPNPKPMPCSSENNAWMTCYKENANDPLKCSHLTKSFADCARRARQQIGFAAN